ncbi:hypothetical protein FKW77_009221 [Venturia effusa]|uniref:BTB domain-containing protein n=1 Tax=Venturia effusa TaxID=50376 RepID=A0A517L9W6_9PEZI|nr:hypothetical protein FKW77_009221 [Venturia effusa]
MERHDDFDEPSDDDNEVRLSGSSDTIFGRRLSPPEETNTSSAAPLASETTLPSSAEEGQRPSVFASTTTTAQESPASSHPMNYSLPASRPLATASSSNQIRRARFLDENVSILGDGNLPQAEKDGDDPTTSEGNDANEGRSYTTTANLTRLLASRAMISSADSSTDTYTLGNPNLVRPSNSSSTASLPDHLYTRGLLGGRHSDISVLAFGHRYNLHRLILDRAPFFATALTEPWIESSSKEISLHPEDIDPSITQKAFELALKRLYGCDISDEEDAEAVGLFATACWLEMQDLVDVAIESILRQMTPESLSPIIKIVTNNYYGRAGERILASAKAMLCRDGWEMALRFWDGIPGETVREIVGGDGFYINGEWERWIVAKRLLDRRLKQKAVECGLLESGSRNPIKAPDTLSMNAIRFDAVYRKNSMTTGGQAPQTQHEKWISLYTHSDVEPILVLLDEGIHYIHLEFERLQYIRQARDVFGLPILPEAIITNALWQQLELRQKVVNARENDLELGLSQPAETLHRTASANESDSASEKSKGKQKVSQTDPLLQDDLDEDDLESGSWDANAQPRKFWVPSTDCNIVMGGHAEPVITTGNTSTFLRLASRMSATLDPMDVLWATDFAASPSTNTESLNRPTTPRPLSAAGQNAPSTSTHPQPLAFSHFPPFRFSAEFPNPRSLKEKKRVYSRTVFYAGSLWNIYIQKVRSAKSSQLGVYLHRAKERDVDEGHALASTTGHLVGTVDERIGLLERQMIMGGDRRERTRTTRVGFQTRGADHRHQHDSNANRGHQEDDGSMSAFRRRTYGIEQGMLDTSFTAFDSEDSDSSESPLNLPHIDAGGPLSTPYDQPGANSSLTHFPPPNPPLTSVGTSSNTSSRLFPAGSFSQSQSQSRTSPALPPYTDARPTIKTYFKIYSPSKGGRLLSVYESAPDKFDFSQSWGWKSSTLMLDEGFSSSPPGGSGGPGSSPRTDAPTTDDDGPSTEQEGSVEKEVMERERERRREKRRRDGALRFMVVIGNL